jgi:MarR family transcriptional regulator, organic hydroperoxide resistance regulator
MRVNRAARSSSGKPSAPAVDHGREAWTLLLSLLRADQGALLRVWVEFDLSSAQGDLLCSLQPKEPTPMVSLARILHCHDSNVTGLVDRLEQRGLIERRGDPKDRRVKLIALTKEGEALRSRLLERLSEPMPFIEALNAKDKTALRDILLRAGEAMKSSSGDE